MIIGSVALRHFYEDSRAPNDLDLVCYNDNCVKRESLGFSGKIESWTGEKYEEIAKLLEKSGNPRFAPPELLLSIKLSHSTYNLTTFSKTLFDINFLKKKGVKFDESDINILTPLWDRLHHRPKGKLNKNNGEFFNDKIERVYVHDSLHEATKYGARPLYESIKTDKNSAITSWRLFTELDHNTRLNVCREEIMVIAIERFLAPKLSIDKNSFTTFESNVAWRDALKLLITSCWRGRWARFLAFNYDELRKPDANHDYIKLFDMARMNDNIERIKVITK